ncbi:HEPN domain-containing protein [uncultured Pseudokineococcus sp.]|uniref:HEPN domain-containing protein n=1 Tax=uncultured Pseudokineococcus sp. TaxID=1642928 RepID=UPI00262109AB|nr:HEPN domain-containing protein [uncultured Pseudokineococcus sp.]
MATSRAQSDVYQLLLDDVKNLLTLHPSSSGTPGRPPGDTGPLLRSAVVLLHTAWENYVEQVAVEGLDVVLLACGDDHSRLHRRLRQALGDLRDPWALAGSGWQLEARRTVEKDVGKLNTPNVQNAERLFDLALGLESGLHELSWQGTGNAKVRENIDEFVHEIRGEIVHKGKTSGRLTKIGVESWLVFFDGVVRRLDLSIAQHLEAVTGTRPW